MDNKGNHPQMALFQVSVFVFLIYPDEYTYMIYFYTYIYIYIKTYIYNMT